MAWETIIVAGLALIGTLGGSWMGVRESNKLSNWRLDRIEEKLDAHNHYGERLSEVEARAKSNTHRLNKLDKEVS